MLAIPNPETLGAVISEPLNSEFEWFGLGGEWGATPLLLNWSDHGFAVAVLDTDPSKVPLHFSYRRHWEDVRAFNRRKSVFANLSYR